MSTVRRAVKEAIQDIISKTEYDCSTPCGANNCECYENRIAIEAIIEYLSSININHV